MFRKLRRRWAYKSIQKFLTEYLPKIGLGNLESFECSHFSFGRYVVKTTKGKYEMQFGENWFKGKEFRIEIMNGEWGFESIDFKIKGNFKFEIYPKRFTVTRDDETQITSLISGISKVYPVGEKFKESEYNFIEYKKPMKEAKFLNLSQIIVVTKDYI